MVLAALLGITLYQLALNFGERLVPAAEASLIIATEPLLIVILARAVLSERVRPAGWVGVGLGLAGVGLMAFRPGSSFAFTADALSVLAASLSAGVYLILQKPLLARYSPLQFTIYSVLFGTVPLLLAFPQLIASWPRAPLSTDLTVVYLGVFPAALANLSWNAALQSLPANLAGNLLFLNPLLASLVAALWTGEVLGARVLLGGAAVLGSLLLAGWTGR
jgi:drug/metabolite transporter (DMT)-like permease